LKIYVSHGTVVTQLKCDGTFNTGVIANCPQYVPVCVRGLWAQISLEHLEMIDKW